MNYGAFGGHAFYEHGSFWVFIALVIFALAAGRQIARLIGAMLDERGASVSAALAEASQLKAEAEAMLAEARKRQAQAETDAKASLETAQVEAATVVAALPDCVSQYPIIPSGTANAAKPSARGSWSAIGS